MPLTIPAYAKESIVSGRSRPDIGIDSSVSVSVQKAAPTVATVQNVSIHRRDDLQRPFFQQHLKALSDNSSHQDRIASQGGVSLRAYSVRQHADHACKRDNSFRSFLFALCGPLLATGVPLSPPSSAEGWLLSWLSPQMCPPQSDKKTRRICCHDQGHRPDHREMLRDDSPRSV